MSINDVFGDAKFGSNKTHWFKFPKEGGTLVLRILPPYGSLKKSGKWAQYYAIHFGYRDSKGRMRPFESSEVKNRANGMVEVVDPALERIKALKAGLQKAQIEGNKDMVTKISEQLRVFNLKKSYYMNVMDLDGKIGVFSIGYKMKMALDAKITELQQRGINPLGVAGGRYFAFTRTGTGANTVINVEVYRDPRTDQQLESTLTADVAQRMLSEGVDLSTLYVKPTSEEIGQIVAANGKEVLEQVLNKYRKNSSELEVQDDGGDGEMEVEALLTTPTQTATPAAQPVATTQAPVAAFTVPTQTAPSTVTVQNPSQMSNDEFFKKLGL